jgi:hypothetical protein
MNEAPARFDLSRANARYWRRLALALAAWAVLLVIGFAYVASHPRAAPTADERMQGR